MSKKRTWISRICALGFALSAAGLAAACLQDANIVIDHALNSPTLTVRYSGAHVAMIELRLNGASFGTRNVDSANAKGETNFTLDLSSLNNGDNNVEVLLYDKAGKLLGTEKSTVSADPGTKAPVYLTLPKVGATVQGPVTINLGFGKDLKNTYVSFFIDNQFKSMTNTPPFSYIWDTTHDTNGWHEVEAWVVDDSSITYKTRKVKVYVNNPGGNTVRQVQPAEATPEVKAPQTAATPITVKPPATAAIQAAQHVVQAVVPAVAARLSSATLMAGTVHPQTGQTAGIKAEGLEAPVATGPQMLLPTGKRVAGVAAAALAGPISSHPTHIAALPAVVHEATTVVPAAVQHPAQTKAIAEVKSLAPIVIGHGTKLPNMSVVSILLDSKPVQFDSVKPRVEDNVPLTPFRYLFEQSGGKVDWANKTKTVSANGNGKEIYIKIGDKLAKVNSLPIEMDLTPFIDHGRTIVPLSFIKDALDVQVDYDPVTGHVLITSLKKKAQK